jgi:ABC-type uncharacterized transport system permease subunit
METVTAQPSALSHFLFVLDNYLRYIASKLLIIVLTVYGFYATWEVTLFVLVEYPELHQRLATHLITQAELNHLIAGVALTVLAAIISAFFAIRLSSTQEKVVHTIDIIVTTSLIIFQGQIREYLLALEFFSNWSQYLQ